VKTPLERLTALAGHNPIAFQSGITLEALQAQAKSQTDLVSTTMQRAKRELFASFVKPKRRA